MPSLSIRLGSTGNGIVKRISLLVLDCDGIVFNSNSLKTEAYRRTLSNLGVDAKGINAFVQLHLSDVSVSRFVKFDKFFREIYQYDTSKLDALINPEIADMFSSKVHYKTPKVDELINKAITGYASECRALYSTLQARNEPVKLAQQIGSKHAYIISGGDQDELRNIFSQKKIAHHFNEICGSPTTKSVHLDRILKETSIEPENVLFIGDGWTDYKTAKKFGTNFIFLEEMSDWKQATEQMTSDFEVTRCKSWADILERVV